MQRLLLPDVPAYIPFTRIQELLGACGVPLKGLRSFEVTLDSVIAEFVAYESDGSFPLIDKGRQTFLVHRIAIPVTHEDSQEPGDVVH